MLVCKDTISEAINKLDESLVCAVDTETTGLDPFGVDRLFSIIIASESSAFYFNFQPYEGLEDKYFLEKKHLDMLKSLFDNRDRLWVMHNAKFDMKMLQKEGLHIRGSVHDTMCIARVLDNQRLHFSLEVCAREVGGTKDDKVEEYINTHKLKKNGKKLYYKVPIDIIVPYGLKDAQITLELYKSQLKKLADLDLTRVENTPALANVVAQENLLTPVIVRMETHGVLVDEKYVTEAIAYETDRVRKAKEEYKKITGLDFVNSGKSLGGWLTNAGVTLPKTDKGNVQVNREALDAVDHPVTAIVRTIRDSDKRVSTYFNNFLSMRDSRGYIHSDFMQHGTVTGRFSNREPNLQNLSKRDKDTSQYPVRRSFIPTHGYCFFMPDYDQMEYRLMVDYAGEEELIRQILEEGADVHGSTAAITGLTREYAKRYNFSSVYGAGFDLLKKQLGCDDIEAERIRDVFESRLPKVASFIKRVKYVAPRRGYVTNWLGRRCQFNFKTRYKAPNHLIQGGCADIVKLAMIRCDDFLNGRKSRIIMNIHDEIVFELHKSEISLAPELCDIMVSAYVPKQLPMSVEPSFSWKSLADKEKGFPK